MKDKISVIVPVYNAALYLEKCIDSILGQSYPHFELLLVDDGSKDRSGEICDEYAAKDDRVRVIHKPNGGVSSARNAGLDAATGKYIVFVDSDDYALPSYFHNLLSLAEDREGTGLVVEGFVQVEGARETPRFFTAAFYDNVAEAIEQSDLCRKGFSVGKIYSAEVVRLHGLRFNEQVSFSEDMLFMLSYLRYCDWVKVSPHADYCYVKHGNDSLMCRYHPYANEMVCYAEFRRFIDEIQERYGMADDAMPCTISWMAHFLMRAISSLYRPGISVDRRSDRLRFYRQVLNDDCKAVIRRAHAYGGGNSLGRITSRWVLARRYRMLDALLWCFFRLRYSSWMRKIRGV